MSVDAEDVDLNIFRILISSHQGEAQPIGGSLEDSAENTPGDSYCQETIQLSGGDTPSAPSVRNYSEPTNRRSNTESTNSDFAKNYHGYNPVNEQPTDNSKFTKRNQKIGLCSTNQVLYSVKLWILI